MSKATLGKAEAALEDAESRGDTECQEGTAVFISLLHGEERKFGEL